MRFKKIAQHPGVPRVVLLRPGTPAMTIAAERRLPFRHIHPWQLLCEGFAAFVEDNALTRGAAIAFYAVTAIAPVLFIASAIAGIFLGPDAASSAVRYQLLQLMSPESATLVQGAIVH